MKICLISYEFPPDIGGEASYSYDLAAGLAALGHDVTVLLPRRQGVEYISQGGFRVVTVRTSALPFLKVATFMAALSGILPELVARDRTEVVHFTFDYPSFPLRVGNVGVPILATVHHLHMAEALARMHAGGWFPNGLSGTCRSFLISLMELILLRQTTAIIAVSRFTQKSLKDYLGVAAARTRVVRDGILLDDLLEATDTGRTRRKFGVGSGPFLVYVGRLEESKGLGYLLDAFAAARESAPSLHLVIVGGGKASFAAGLQKKAALLGLKDSVTFAGKVSRGDLCEFYAASEAVILPSLMEGFGISIVEAMAAGKPCIATRVGAVPEVVQHNLSGILVPPANSQGLSAAVLRLVSSPSDIEAMGRSGRELAIREFTAERMVRETLAVYNGCARGRSSPHISTSD